MAATDREAADVSTLAALAWTWISLAGESRPVAQASIMRTFQGQYNARLASLRSAYSHEGMTPPFAISQLTVNGAYSGSVARAVMNVTYIAGGRTAAQWLSQLPATRYDDIMFQMIWDEIARGYPISRSGMLTEYLWTMLRSIIAVPDEQAGQIALNAVARIALGTNAQTSYQMTADQRAAALAAKGSNALQTLVAGEDAAYQIEAEEGMDRSYLFDEEVVDARRQQRTNSYAIWLVMAGVVGIGAVVYSRYRRENA